MSTQNHIAFLNENDPAFLKAKHGTEKQREEWEDEHGPIADRPGAPIEPQVGTFWETKEEYGGIIVDLKMIPKDATHIVFFRC